MAQFGPAEPLPNGRYTPCSCYKTALNRGATPGDIADGQSVSKLERHRAVYYNELLGALPGTATLTPPAAVRELPRVCDQCHLH